MIGQRVKELRNAAHLTQAQLADGIISRTYLSLIEKNAVHPSTNVLKKLSERLGCTLEDFTTSSSDRNLSLLEVKKEIKWAENHVMMNDLNKLPEFIDKEYEHLESITEIERGIIYWIRASYAFEQEDYDKARHELAQCIDIVKRMKDVTVYLRALVLLGRVEFKEKNLKEAIRQLTIANNITIFENVTNTSRVSILSYLGEYYRLIGENIVAINFCEDALALNRKLNTHHFGLYLENTLGKAHLVLKHYDEAAYHMRRALKYAELNVPGEETVGVLTNMAVLLSETDESDEAFVYIQRAMDLVDAHQFDFPFVLNVKLRYCEMLAKVGRLKEAKEFIEPYIESDNTGYAAEIMGDILTLEGNYQGAITYYLQALDGNDKSIYLAKINPKISRLYRRMGQIDKALEYYEKSIHEYEELLIDMV